LSRLNEGATSHPSTENERILSIIRNYDFLLQRLYRKVPVPAGSGERFAIPKPRIIRIGSTTILHNFREIADVMRRDPKLLTRYLLKELATAGSYDEESGALKLNIVVSARALSVLLERFARQYVICPTCGRPDTKLEKRERIFVLKCEACGAEQPMKGF